MDFTNELKVEFRERIMGENQNEIDYESSWAVLNGLVITFLKATGDCTAVKEEALNEQVKKVILSLPKYELCYGKDYKLNVEDKKYFALCPQEIAEGLSYDKINEAKIIEIANNVLRMSARRGVKEDSKMRIADRGVSKASMSEFEEMNASMLKMYDVILKTRGEEGLKTAMAYYTKLAEKAVEDEIEFNKDNASYIIKFYSSILQSKEGEMEA